MQKVHISDISEGQLRKLERGLPIQLRHDQISSAETPCGHVMCHPTE
jgi:hypothetical protein